MVGYNIAKFVGATSSEGFLVHSFIYVYFKQQGIRKCRNHSDIKKSRNNYRTWKPKAKKHPQVIILTLLR